VCAFSPLFRSPPPHWLLSNKPSELEKYCIGPCNAHAWGPRRGRVRGGGTLLLVSGRIRLVTVNCCACKQAASSNFCWCLPFF
jgi:hypothetical protein